MIAADLQLTPGQQAELDRTDPALVSAWLEAVGLQQGLKSPVGWFLAGVRTGQPPHDLDDARRRQALARAERLVQALGGLIPDEAELVATLFGPPALTADLETLERVESQVAGTVLHAHAVAQLARTRRLGRQEIAATDAVLAGYDTPGLRERMVALWQRRRAETVVAGDNADIDWGTE